MHSKNTTTAFSKKLTRAIQPTESVPFLESNTYELPLKQEKEIAMTNHGMIAAAMMEYRGKIIEPCEIKRIVLKTYPNFTEGSLLPNDHAFGNKNPCRCVGTESRIFDRVEPKKYLVR
jgi:hypothetical protein